MKKKSFFLSFIVVVLGLAFTMTFALCAAEEDSRHAELVLFDFGRGFDVGSVKTSDAKVTLSEGGALLIETGHNKPWPGITLKAPAGPSKAGRIKAGAAGWDLSKYEYVSMDVKNVGSEPVTVYCRVDNPGADGSKNCVTDSITLTAQEEGTLMVRIFPVPWRLSEPVELVGMRAAPVHSGPPKAGRIKAGAAGVDASNITQLLVFIRKPGIDHTFEIKNIRAAGRVELLDAKTFFPFIDEFGQFIHSDWPGKTHSLEELIAHGQAEENDLAAHPGPADRDEYGGWTQGPGLEATGFFRVEKYQGKWWMVDPQGRLFWSHGIDCVRSANATPITDREHYYRNLPEADSPFAIFYGTGSWAPHGYYKDHSPYETYDFSRANFLRKYGRNWEKALADITHRRLKSWGMNTIANWSDSSIYLMRRTPYVCTVNYSARRLEGSEGYWDKFYDVFDLSFRHALRRQLASEEGLPEGRSDYGRPGNAGFDQARLRRGRPAGDPWCIGYFVHNELSWGDEVSLAVATLICPADQPAKKVFVDDLKAKYRTIDKLNATWGTSHATWEVLLQNRQAPDKQKAWADLTAFYTTTAETYFRTIREELKEVAPDQLYMGCRFAWVNDRAARAAAKFCDVVSYNRYRYSVEEHRPPDGIDKPTIIGEFHFGALDRGMFHTGLRKTANQQDRAAKYKSYVRGALRNPYIVGTHWFQYKDQATTGRGDGENYQIGFVDICDKPYPEIVQACREVAGGTPDGSGRPVAGGLYEFRLESK